MQGKLYCSIHPRTPADHLHDADTVLSEGVPHVKTSCATEGLSTPDPWHGAGGVRDALKGPAARTRKGDRKSLCGPQDPTDKNKHADTAVPRQGGAGSGRLPGYADSVSSHR